MGAMILFSGGPGSWFVLVTLSGWAEGRVTFYYHFLRYFCYWGEMLF